MVANCLDGPGNLAERVLGQLKSVHPSGQAATKFARGRGQHLVCLYRNLCIHETPGTHSILYPPSQNYWTYSMALLTTTLFIARSSTENLHSLAIVLSLSMRIKPFLLNLGCSDYYTLGTIDLFINCTYRDQ